MAWDLQLTSPLTTSDLSYRLAGVVNAPGEEDSASIRVRSLETGWTEEVFLKAKGEFDLSLDLTPDADQDYELNVCDGPGRVVARVQVRIQHRSIRGAEGKEGT